MTCEVKKQYRKDDYFDIYVELELANGDPIAVADLFENLNNIYESSVAKAIQSAIEDGTFNENWDIQPGISPSPVDAQFNFNGAKNSETEVDPLTNYYYNKQNGYVRLSNMTSRFFEDIISKVLYDKSTGAFYRPTTNSINKALYDYKVDLLHNIWQFTGISHEVELIGNPDNLTRVISQTLSDFSNRSVLPEADVYWDDYIILKQFDSLLKQYAPFIKKNIAFENTSYQTDTMYVWDPAGTYRQSWTDSEDSDISKTVSPLVRMLADYFTCADENGNEINRPIGFTTFNIAMATLATWLHENRHINAVADVNRDIRKNGLNADFSKAIDVYVANASPNDSLKEVLWGIKKHVFKKNAAIPLSIKEAFANQFFITAKYSYMAYRQNLEKGEYDINGEYLEDSFINLKQAALQRIMQNKVWFHQYQPELFSQLKIKHGIVTTNVNGTVTIKFDPKHWGVGFQIMIESDGDTISIKDTLPDGVLPLDSSIIGLVQDCFDVLIPSDYQNVLDAMSVNTPIPATLFGVFHEPLAILLAASEEGKDFASIFKYNDDTDLIQTYNFKNRFIAASKFESIVDGINDLNVLKNGEGNNLPIYQLAPAIFDIFTIIDEIYDSNKAYRNDFVGALPLENTVSKELNNWWATKEASTVFVDNLFVANKDILKKIIVRSDVKIGNTVKASDKLSVSEVASLSIFNDFYQNLVREPDSNNPEALSGIICIQPITYSDKKTHFLPAIDLAKLKILKNGNYESALSLFRNIVNPSLSQNERLANINSIQDEISRVRKSKNKIQIWNQELRFGNVFSNSKTFTDNVWETKAGKIVSANEARIKILNGVRFGTKTIDTYDPVQGIKRIATILKNLNEFKNPLSLLRTVFKQNGTLLSEDFDFYEKNGNLYANESLLFNAVTYSNSQNTANYLNQQKLKFAFDLQEYGVQMDVMTHPELRSYVERFSVDSRKRWYDPHSGIMRAFRIFETDATGQQQEIFPTQADFENDTFKHRTDLSVQLNPMLEGYFYANSLFGNQFNDILFGGTEGYIPKFTGAIDFENPDMSILGQMMASRLANEFKRTTYGGAIKRKFAQGLQFGVDPKIRFAIVEDDEPKISTLRGDTKEQVAQDGSGWVLPALARMIQKSLVDSPVGDVRKTIAGWNDPRTGTQVHFKWAETTITAYMRQKSQGDGSAEVIYRKGMSAVNIGDRFKSINDFSKYYNPQENATVYNIAGNDITRTKPIYRYDIDEGYYEKIEAIRNTINGLQIAWSRVDKSGAPIYEDGKPVRRISDPVQINTLYDLDQALGGAFVFELDENGDMVASEGVHDIIYNIICTNDLKDAFVGYVVNHSAAKAGAINVNDYSTLNDDDVSLNYHYLSSFGIGVQMDADHEMEFASVTEMSQMISLLTQSGNNVSTVNKAYTDIGSVAAEAMRDILAVVNTNDTDVYRIIGKALIDTFSSGNREELGLAQAFIRNAQNAILKEKGLDNIILPYSAESVRGSFVSAVMSMINKKGIKRKYSGFGGVQVPADKTMQHYVYRFIENDVAKELPCDYLGLRDRIRQTLKQNGWTWTQVSTQQYINGIWNPFIIKIDPKSIQFEDTVVYRQKGSIEEGVVLKIQTAEDRDLVRNLLDNTQYDVFVWTTKPRELAQSDILFETDYGILSEYDLDPIRASFYLNEIINWKKGKIQSIPFMNRKIDVINSAISDSDLVTQDGTSIDSMKNLLSMSEEMLIGLKKLCVHKAQLMFNEISEGIQSNQRVNIGIQMSLINDDTTKKFIEDNEGKRNPVLMSVSPNIKNLTMQVVIGRRNFKKFGLRRGDKLADVKEQGWKFFYNRLIENTGLIDKVKSQIPASRFDGVLQFGNGENCLVLVGDQSDNLQYFSKNDDFVASDNAISYKGQIIVDDSKLRGVGTISQITCLSYTNDVTGEQMPVLWVPDYDTFDRIATSNAVTSSIYNYNPYNWVNVIKHQYASKFDKDGKLIEAFATDSGVNVINIDDTDIYEALNKNEHKIRKKQIERKAKVLYRNFIQQLNYIQTRIPSQAMQSTANIEVIDFADTDVNYIWVPKMIFLLQGSDLDIDKAYCMGYDVDDAGNIYSLSNLIYTSKYNVDDILSLPAPTFGTMKFNSSDGIGINIDVTDKINDLMINGASDFEILKSLINLYQSNPGRTINIIYNNGQPSNYDDRIMNIVNDIKIHEQSFKSEDEVEHALRNQVLTSARKIMSNPASQLDAYTPIAMAEPRKAAELNTALGSKEKEMTLDNPMSIFIMQMQNMSGKEVIAMTATGIKSYFLVTTYFNTLAKQIEADLEDYILTKNVDKLNNILVALNEITFDGKLDDSTEPYLYTFANINFSKIRKLINSNVKIREMLKAVNYTADIQNTKANTAFSKYVTNNVANLTELIDNLDIRANGNIWTINDKGDFEYFVINAPDSLSALLSAATDNAKELILDKLNATSKFADIYTTLLSQGVPFIKIAKMMTNNAFRIVAKYAQNNIFEVNTSNLSVQNSINFVLNESQLPNISKGLLEKYLTDNVSIGDNHKHEGFLHQLLREGTKVTDGKKVESLAEIIYTDVQKETGYSNEEIFDKIKNRNIILSVTSDSASIVGAIAMSDNNELKNSLAKVILNLFNDTYRTLKEGYTVADYMKSLLSTNLRKGLELYSIASPIREQNEYEPDLDYDPVEFMYDMSEQELSEDIEAVNKKQSYWFNGELRKKELKTLYRYAIQYFIPKTELWNALTPEDKAKAKLDFKKLSTEILYSAKEMRILGALGSINQGVRTKDFDEYNFIKNIEKFINNAYINRGDGEITETFDFMRFLTNTEYRNRHIDNYDKVKSSVNVLRAIDKAANFKEMLSYLATGRKMLERSAAIKLERRIADQLFEKVAKVDEKSGISRASTMSLNSLEFRVLSQYVRDSIVYNFFRNLDNLRFTIPAGQRMYEPDRTTTAEPHISEPLLSKRSLPMDNIHNLATFKHLMDWYIIPKLQLEDDLKDNAFIRSLSRDRYTDPKSKKAVVSFKVNVPLINIDSSPKAKDKYSAILSGFNELLYKPIPKSYDVGDWTIGNLFFIYNLLVNKDRIGANALTRLFEDLISSGNKQSLPYIYYQYLSDLDKGAIKIFNEDGSINQETFVANLNDLQYRLSGTQNASKFGVNEIKNGKVIKSVEIDGEDPISPIDDVFMISDYILNLPFATKQVINLKGNTHNNYAKGFNSEDIVLASSKTVFDTMAEELSRTYGKDIPIEILTETEIDTEFADRTEQERADMKQSTGFILNGNLYLNGSKNSLDAPMHEIMHFIAAAMKFSKDPSIRDNYYKLLDWVTDWLDGKVKSGEVDDADLRDLLIRKSQKYNNRHMSDRKEEILVTLLAREFKSQFYNIWGNSRTIKPQMIQANIKQVLAQILNTDKILDLDFNELGNATLSSVLKKFSSQILSTDSTLLLMSINQNQEMAELKNLLIKGGFIELSEDCL